MRSKSAGVGKVPLESKVGTGSDIGSDPRRHSAGASADDEDWRREQRQHDPVNRLVHEKRSGKAMGRDVVGRRYRRRVMTH